MEGSRLDPDLRGPYGPNPDLLLFQPEVDASAALWVEEEYRELKDMFSSFAEHYLDAPELNYSPASIEFVEGMLQSIHERERSDFNDAAKVVLARYVADTLRRNLGQDLVIGPSYRDGKLVDLTVIRPDKGKAHVLSWVEKNAGDPESEEVTAKFNGAMRYLEKEPDVPPEDL